MIQFYNLIRDNLKTKGLNKNIIYDKNIVFLQFCCKKKYNNFLHVFFILISYIYLLNYKLQKKLLINKIKNMSEIIEENKSAQAFDANSNVIISPEERREMIEKVELKFSEIMEIMRISREDPNCEHTPHRLAKMYINEIFAGRYTAPPSLTFFPNRKNVDNLVISQGIQVMSICSHHWQTIAGKCTIGYIPNKRIIGLSKLSRIVDWFARRGQIQEEMGEQIADYLVELLRPKAVGVVIRAKHYCMIARGIKGSEDDTIMTTSVMRGYLQNDLKLRNEFINLIK